MTRIRQKGFTIVELLIVIVVIGILAAITIVAFNGVQSRAKVASVQSLVKLVSKKVNIYYAANGQYPTLTQLQNNTAIDSTVAGSGPPEAAIDSGIVGNAQPVAANGTKYVRYAIDTTYCSSGYWIDWYDYDNNRNTSGSTTPRSIRECIPL